MLRSVATLAVLLSSFLLHAQQTESKPPELPRHAKINGHEWNLGFVDYLKGVEVANADCDYHTIKILSSIVNQREVADALMHELMHALDDCQDTAWNNTGYDEDPQDGHQGIYMMAPRLLDLLVDNPDLIRFLQYKGQGK